MAVLDVGRLHARYRNADAAAAERLDRVLGVVAVEALAGTVADRGLPRGHAVCLRTLDVPVALDPDLPPAALSLVWADAIVDALMERLTMAGDDVVVYERELDLLVEVVRLVAAGDHSRVWAWRQTGAVDAWSAWPGAAEVAALLRRRALLVPGVLRAAPAAVASVLEVDGWRAVARSFRAVAGGPRAVAEVERGEGRPAVHEDRRPVTVERAVAAARRIVPEPVWAAVATDAAVDLAVMALACAAPALSRDPAVVARVVAARASGTSAPERRHRPLADASGSAAAQATAAGEAAADATRPDWSGSEPRSDREPAARAAGGDDDPAFPRPDAPPVVTADGGVLYLIHGVSDLELAPEAGGWDALARVLSTVSGVAADDPAVLVAAGAPDDPPLDVLRAPLDGDRAAVLAALAARLEGWVRGRLDDDDDDGDLGWVWRRRAFIAAEPGWIEATFALADVDIRLRRAGLDLDPGYVWWLGQVVRFRHV